MSSVEIVQGPVGVVQIPEGFPSVVLLPVPLPLDTPGESIVSFTHVDDLFHFVLGLSSYDDWGGSLSAFLMFSDWSPEWRQEVFVEYGMNTPPSVGEFQFVG